jgi:hypothetical protein
MPETRKARVRHPPMYTDLIALPEPSNAIHSLVNRFSLTEGPEKAFVPRWMATSRNCSRGILIDAVRPKVFAPRNVLATSASCGRGSWWKFSPMLNLAQLGNRDREGLTSKSRSAKACQNEMELQMAVQDVFKHCVEAIQNGVLIQRVSATDKEFHFQNWFKSRLEELQQNFEIGGRNSYPDFRIVATTDGYELKGLAYPGRDASFDSNSQVPAGFHNGRTIYYVFGRYPKKPDGNTYPVLDLVLCHGNFLNADHEYVHENKSVRGFGSYGDILIRDRKMYVVPTPFRIADGIAHHQTLILPADQSVGDKFVQVGELRRREAQDLIVGYSFDLQTNDLIPKKVPNPGAGREHVFRAWRPKGSPADAVTLRAGPVQVDPAEADEAEDAS